MSEPTLLPDLVPVEVPKYSDDWHHVEIDWGRDGWDTTTFVCTAPKGSACRSLPLCQHAGGRCEDYEGGHAEACTDRTPVDTGECLTREWIENSEETARGKVRFPVSTEWDGDYWIWKPRNGEAVAS